MILLLFFSEERGWSGAIVFVAELQIVVNFSLTTFITYSGGELHFGYQKSLTLVRGIIFLLGTGACMD